MLFIHNFFAKIVAKSCFHLPYIILTLITIFAKNFSSYIAIMLSFDNTELAYAYKTNAELKKSQISFGQWTAHYY